MVMQSVSQLRPFSASLSFEDFVVRTAFSSGRVEYLPLLETLQETVVLVLPAEPGCRRLPDTDVPFAYGRVCSMRGETRCQEQILDNQVHIDTCKV